jgi:geranylgeranyl transferase type-2 subunit alpha
MSSDSLAPFPQSLTTPLSQNLKAYQLKLAEDELRYTLSKIESNFSNFSAWHHRSLLLVPIWTAKGLDGTQRRKERDDEFELIRQAMFVDPDDQSVWTYHSWLLGLGESYWCSKEEKELKNSLLYLSVPDSSTDVLQREIASVRELLELEEKSKCE